MEYREVAAAVSLTPGSFSSDNALRREPTHRLQLPDSALEPTFDGTVRTPDGPIANDCNDCDEPTE